MATAACLIAAIATATGTGTSIAAPASDTATPIKHLVVIFPENISFDHYFGTYPNAVNLPGEPAFHAAPGTPTINGLTPELLTHNPNAANPQRLDRSEALVCDQDHDYAAEQQAFDHGLMDKFIESTDNEKCAAPHISKPGLVMDYYDGNTVTGLWNYAQRFAMSDNSYSTVFGPTVPGHLNLVSGQTHGAISSKPSAAVVNGTVISTSVSAAFEDCPKSPTAPKVQMTGKNIGDLLNAKNINWGYFSGGFRPTSRNADGTAVCGSHHLNIGGENVEDYHDTLEPFQYYKSTANPHHLPPASSAEIGRNGQANHQYDLSDFWTAVDAGNMPTVSYLKPRVSQDAHPAQSDPLDEQHFIVDTMNRLQKSKDWKDTAVVLAYDDSDGWYDHQMSPIVNDSQSSQDALTGDGMCGARTPLAGYQNRCGHGPRQPLMVFSPYSKVNSVDHALTDQTSILRFIEDNWLGGQRIGDGSFDALAGSLNNMFDFSHPYPKPLILDPNTGEPRN
ncbi:alkaline phosphatase family protein [Streptomyces sp. NPDC048415]|uniref:phospholipase C n=1 Tax=Streptomyces sp. NPDC048415 TaxID=3154822 RepID=UPI0034472ABF